jgi:hypothetical protein
MATVPTTTVPNNAGMPPSYHTSTTDATSATGYLRGGDTHAQHPPASTTGSHDNIAASIEADNEKLKLELAQLQQSLDTMQSAAQTAAQTTPTPTTTPQPPTTPTADISDIPTYTGYTFWSSDFHISPIADLKDILTPMGHTIIDKSLSGHCKLMKPKTCATDANGDNPLKVLDGRNGIALGLKNKGIKACPNQLKRSFFEAYKTDPTMLAVDAFLCNHAIGQCEIYMGFGRPLVAIASTRYEIGRYGRAEWIEWNKNLRDIAADPRNVVAANNRYDAEYIKYFTGLKDVPVIPNYCGYTEVTYKPSRKQVLIGPGRGVSETLVKQLKGTMATKSDAFEFAIIRELYPHFEYSDLVAHPAIVLLPYQVSLMSLFEYYRMNIPMFAPSPRLLAEWQLKYRVMSELTWDMVWDKPKARSNNDQFEGGGYLHDPNNMMSEEAIADWIKYADFYEWPHIETYDSWDELHEKLRAADLKATSEKMKLENVKIKQNLDETWKRNLHRMFDGVKPSRVEPRGFEESWDAGMLKYYGITAGACGVGDDRHSKDVSHVLIDKSYSN